MRALAVVTAVVLGLLSPPDASAYLTFVEAYVDGVSGVDGLLMAQDVAVSPDGLHAYAVSEGDHAVVRFDRDTMTGELTFVEAIVDGQNGVTGITFGNGVVVSPDGAHVYVVSGANTGAVAVFARNALTGALTFVEAELNNANGVSGLTVGEDVVVSPDGANVYVLGFTPGAILTFARDAGTGALTFVEKDQEGVNGLDGIAFATALVISPDGKHVYVTANSDDSVAVFARDAGGALTFVEAERDGVGGVDGIDAPFAIGISADGKHVYAGGSNEDAVAVFSRDGTTGALTFVQVLFDGVNGVDGLDFPQGIVVTPDGSAVLVAAAGDDAVGVFARDAASGMLTFVEKVGAAGLGGVNAVHLGPGAAHLYTTARDAGAVALLAVDSSPPTTTTSSSTTTTTSTSDTSTTSPSTTTTSSTSSPPTTSSTSSSTSSSTTAPGVSTSTSTSPATTSSTSTSLPGSTSSTSTSLAGSTSSTTSTTTSTTAGPTTTLVASCVEPGSASFSSIRCRLEALRTATAGTGALGDLRPKLATPLGKAVDRAGEAQSFCAGRDTKRARGRLKQTIRQLVQYARRLRGPKARSTAPAEVRDPLVAEANEIRGDATTLRRAVDCSTGAT